MENRRILVINPKYSSTKLAIYSNSKLLFLKTIKYKQEDLDQFDHVNEQKNMRKEAILKELSDNDFRLERFVAIVGRGGLLKPMNSGVYEVNKLMKEDLLKGIMGSHATNLGGIIADEIAEICPNAKAYIADPAVVDELDEIARYTGHPLFHRKSIFHALNHKVVARKYAKSINKKYEEIDLIVVHIGGGGVSVGAHHNGKAIDVNQAFDGSGPMGVERTGSLPVGQIVRMCFSGKYTEDEVMDMIVSEGGLYAYLGTDDIDEIENRIDSGDENARFIMDVMAYQIAKEIGSMCPVLLSRPEAVILSGDIFHHKRFTNSIIERVEKVAPVLVYPDEDEVEALALNIFLALKGEIPIKEYV